MPTECPECGEKYQKSGLFGHLKYAHDLRGDRLRSTYERATNGASEERPSPSDSEQGGEPEPEPVEAQHTTTATPSSREGSRGATAAEVLGEPDREGKPDQRERSKGRSSRPDSHEGREAQAHREAHAALDRLARCMERKRAAEKHAPKKDGFFGERSDTAREFIEECGEHVEEAKEDFQRALKRLRVERE